MRRIAPLAALVAAFLLSLLAGCDDSAPPSATGDTIAVGTLPAAEVTAAPTDPSTPPPPTSDGGGGAEPESTEDEEPPSTDDAAPASTEGDEEGEPSSTEEPTTTTSRGTAPSASDDRGPARTTRFVVELDGLVEDEPPARHSTTALRDDTGRLRLDVPREWADHRTAPSRLPDGSETPSLAAAPALTSFLDGYDTAGLTALVVGEEPQDALDAYAFAGDCFGGRAGEYRTDGATGEYEVWESCGGTINDIVVVAVRPDGAADTVLLLVQVVDAADLAALDAALESLTLDG